jgi:hypothetical protein
MMLAQGGYVQQQGGSLSALRVRGAAVGVVAGAIRPRGYGLRWCFLAWAGATVVLVLAQILNGGEFEEQTGVFQLTTVAGMVGGGVAGSLLGAWLCPRVRARLLDVGGP